MISRRVSLIGGGGGGGKEEPYAQGRGEAQGHGPCGESVVHVDA